MKKPVMRLRSQLKKIEWKKYYVRIFSGILLLVLAIFVVSNIWMHIRLVEMDNRMAYLQDTTNVIQTDLGSLQSDIEKTLREENSFLENYSIDVVDTDFSAGTYQLAISAIPKEYTEQTQMSIYFGTTEYKLEKDGFNFIGTVELPLDESYKGNVTILITNGKKKNTEVMDDYVGFQEQFDNILTGSMDTMPSYRNGHLSIREDIEFVLEGQNTYGVSGFKSLLLIVQAGSKTICSEELITEKTIQENEVQTAENSPNGVSHTDSGNASPERQGMDAQESIGDTEMESFGTIARTVSGLYGNHYLNLREDVQGGTQVRILLQAVSTDGYTFVYELFAGTTEQDGDDFVEQETYFTGDYSVYDRKGGRYEP